MGKNMSQQNAKEYFRYFYHLQRQRQTWIVELCLTHTTSISELRVAAAGSNCIESIDRNQCDQKKSPNIYKSCPKMISLEKLKILTPLQKLPKNGGDLGKSIVAKDFKKLPKVQ